MRNASMPPWKGGTLFGWLQEQNKEHHADAAEGPSIRPVYACVHVCVCDQVGTLLLFCWFGFPDFPVFLTLATSSYDVETFCGMIFGCLTGPELRNGQSPSWDQPDGYKGFKQLRAAHQQALRNRRVLHFLSKVNQKGLLLRGPQPLTAVCMY